MLSRGHFVHFPKVAQALAKRKFRANMYGKGEAFTPGEWLGKIVLIELHLIGKVKSRNDGLVDSKTCYRDFGGNSDF